MNEERGLVVAQRLAAMERALAAGSLSVTFGAGTATEFKSVDEMRAMRDEMQRAAAGVHVRFRPNTPPGSRNEMPVSILPVVDAVAAALNGVGVILTAAHETVFIATLRNPKSAPGFLRDLRTR